MGSYALGYYTPPLPAGEGPEIVPPEFALGRADGAPSMGTAEMRQAVTADKPGA